VRFKNNNNNTVIHPGRINLIKSDNKGIYNVTKDPISNKCCSFELSIHQIILKNEITVSTNIWTVFNTDDNHKCLLIRSSY